MGNNGRILVEKEGYFVINFINSLLFFAADGHFEF